MERFGDACKKKISIRVGSFFERSQLKIRQIIGITYIGLVAPEKVVAFQ